jgi:hypothetical protein
MNAQHPQNSNVQQARTFSKQAVLNHVPRNLEEERLALRFLDKWAPDLVGVIMGGVL